MCPIFCYFVRRSKTPCRKRNNVLLQYIYIYGRFLENRFRLKVTRNVNCYFDSSRWRNGRFYKLGSGGVVWSRELGDRYRRSRDIVQKTVASCFDRDWENDDDETKTRLVLHCIGNVFARRPLYILQTCYYRCDRSFRMKRADDQENLRRRKRYYDTRSYIWRVSSIKSKQKNRRYTRAHLFSCIEFKIILPKFVVYTRPPID